jgi:acyl-CoA dehydrogenase
MDSELSERSEQWRGRLQAFFEHDVLPCHRDWLEHVAPRREVRRSTGELQAKARAAGLRNRGLPELAPDESGTRLSNLDHAPLAEIMGRLFWAPEFFNCQAPDVPNMIALQNCATPAQKQKWLHPLLNAETRSAFGMTEPDVASSDATNIATTMLRDGDDFVISGRKWFITGAAHPRCSFLIVLGVSHPDADRTRRHSCIIVPMDAPGVRLVRRLRWMGCEDHTAPIGVLAFDNVRASRENLLGADGDGFRAAQVRLGPARIHHCMRSIGLCELLIELMMVRSAERSAFGRPIIQYDTVQRWSAESRVELKQARLLCLSLCLAVGPDRPSRRKFFDKELARRVADQGRRSRHAAADRRPRHAGVRRDGRLRRYAYPPGAGLGASVADRRRAGPGAFAADLQDGDDTELGNRQFAVSRRASRVSQKSYCYQ